MVHSIKRAAKMGNHWETNLPLQCTVHMHTYFCDSFYLDRICQNWDGLATTYGTLTSFCSLTCQGDPWNASVWYSKKCITMQQGCWEFKNIDMWLHIFTVVNIKIPVCWRTVFSETQETVIQKQSFRGAPSTGRNSETEGSSCLEI